MTRSTTTDDTGPHEITRLLQSMDAENGEATIQRVFVALRGAIRAAAARELTDFADDTVLQATALSNDLFIRVVKSQGASEDDQAGSKSSPRWKDSKHFLASMVTSMRHLLVDNARARCRIKRGGGAKRIIATEESVTTESDPMETLFLDDALQALSKRDSAAAELAEMHVMGGLTWEDAGNVMGIPERQRRTLVKAIKAFLTRELGLQE